jgi:dihydroorotate dehydrogenase
MYEIIRNILFLFDAEFIHDLIGKILKFPPIGIILNRIYHYEHPLLETELFGMHFKNPVGLAAGFDKNADLVDQIPALGFGFIEIGTVTPKPQLGNAKPRLFRLNEDEALINRMGFNNNGVKKIKHNLCNKRSTIIIGGNIGKNKLTANDEAFKDYEICFNELFDVVDYFVINVSSPNTPGLRELQDREPLVKLLNHLQKLNDRKEKPKPIFFKIAPDLSDQQLDEIIDIIKVLGIDGVVATNTTINRDDLKSTSEQIKAIGDGGLSGKPLRERSTAVIAYLAEKSNRAFPIIGVGGIHSPEDAIEKLQAGASLIQVYTGFIYEGPGLIKKIKKQIVEQGLLNISDKA